MDPLRDVLETIDLTGVIFLRAELGEEFGISMPPPTVSHPSIKPLSREHRLVMFHIVREGRGYVEVEGFAAEPLEAGDLIIILDDRHHSIVDRPGRATIPSSQLVPERTDVAAPPAAFVGPGRRTMRLVCGMLQFVDRGFNPAYAALPPFLLVRRDHGPSSEWMRVNLDHVIREAEASRPGNLALLSRLTELLFVETLRAHIERTNPDAGGWFAALKDPGVGRALGLIHQSPEHPWTVGELARRSGVSRSGLAARFAELLDLPPMVYVTRWRMRLAMRLLREPQLSLADVAERVGYASVSAFSRAFKKECNEPPSAFRAGRPVT